MDLIGDARTFGNWMSSYANSLIYLVGWLLLNLDSFSAMHHLVE